MQIPQFNHTKIQSGLATVQLVEVCQHVVNLAECRARYYMLAGMFDANFTKYD